MKTIIFDETCPAWTMDTDYNLLFLRLQAVDIEFKFEPLENGRILIHIG